MAQIGEERLLEWRKDLGSRKTVLLGQSTASLSAVKQSRTAAAAETETARDSAAVH